MTTPVTPEANGGSLRKPATDFYFVETRGPAGKKIAVAVECSVCKEEFRDTRVGDRVVLSCVDKAIEHSKQSHQVSRIAFQLNRKPRARAACKGRFL
jgi:hypothetical protein